MLRALLFLALLANGVLWAHGQGWLAALGWPLADHREPARMSQQVAPEGVRLLNGPAAEATAPAALPASATDADPLASDAPAAPAPPAAER